MNRANKNESSAIHPHTVIIRHKGLSVGHSYNTKYTCAKSIITATETIAHIKKKSDQSFILTQPFYINIFGCNAFDLIPARGHDHPRRRHGGLCKIGANVGGSVVISEHKPARVFYH